VPKFISSEPYVEILMLVFRSLFQYVSQKSQSKTFNFPVLRILSSIFHFWWITNSLYFKNWNRRKSC